MTRTERDAYPGEMANGPADELRTVDQLGLPDCRMTHFHVRHGSSFRPMSQLDRWEAIRQLELHPEVPEEIRTHYNTARNVYLFAWHVYRFHVVAEHQVLATLEMALRQALFERCFLDQEGRPLAWPAAAQASTKQPRPLTLSNLLTLARSKGVVQNNGFTRRLKWAQQLADGRRRLQEVEFMQRNNITEMVFPDEPAVPTIDELECDWLDDLVEAIPRLRNEYAHGTQMLHATVLRTFEMVSELVNQLWPTASSSIADPACRPP